jgi:hypothetical protein
MIELLGNVPLSVSLTWVRRMMVYVEVRAVEVNRLLALMQGHRILPSELRRVKS